MSVENSNIQNSIDSKWELLNGNIDWALNKLEWVTKDTFSLNQDVWQIWLKFEYYQNQYWTEFTKWACNVFDSCLNLNTDNLIA